MPAVLSFKPAALSLEFVAGDDVPIVLTFSTKSDAGVTTPLDLTGSQVSVVINSATPFQQCLVAMSITDPANGKASGILPSSMTSPLNTTEKPVKRDWFVYVVDSLGHRRTYISGAATVLPRI
jgi:hypothetical protein